MKKTFNEEEANKVAAKRKKRLIIEMIIGFIAFVGGVVLAIVGVVKQLIPLLVVGIVVALLGLIFMKIVFSKSVKYCDSCGKSIKGCEYSYQETRRNAANSGGMDIHVEIAAKCPHCGATKIFHKKFNIRAGQNPQYEVDNYCRRKFGH